MNRDKKIIRASVINIVGNVALAIAKGIAGFLTGSIAIILDAVNSLTDALASVIAIIGTKIAGRPANHEHPYGYGRVEYLSSICIAALILAAGLSSFKEAVSSIIHPTTPQYGIVSLVIVVCAAAVKFGLGLFLMREGNKLESGSLVASGTDSLMDGGVSAATFVAALIYLFMGLQVESWLAAGIAILIIKNGLGILMETASKLLGERVSPDVAAQVEREVRSVDGVRLASGLMVQDFGPNRLQGSIFVTVDGNMRVAEFDSIVRSVQKRVFEKCKIVLVGVTPYPDASHDENVRDMRASIGRIVWGHDHVVELRGLYVNTTDSTVRFDAIVDFDAGDPKPIREQIVKACEDSFPDWNFQVRVLPDVSD